MSVTALGDVGPLSLGVELSCIMCGHAPHAFNGHHAMVVRERGRIRTSSPALLEAQRLDSDWRVRRPLKRSTVIAIERSRRAVAR